MTHILGNEQNMDDILLYFDKTHMDDLLKLFTVVINPSSNILSQLFSVSTIRILYAWCGASAHTCVCTIEIQPFFMCFLLKGRLMLVTVELNS